MLDRGHRESDASMAMRFDWIWGMAKRSVQTNQTPDNGCALAIILGVIVIAILGIGKCSGGTTSNTMVNELAAINANMSSAIAAQTPSPPEPLSAASVTRGIGHLRLAVGVEGFSGAMIYSQNCYDALTHEFSWAKLDACGAFDMLAVRSMPEADTGDLASEVTYFESETAAGRYLAAATGAGEAAPEADQRLSQLQARIARTRTAGRTPPPPAPTRADANTSTVGDGDDPGNSLDSD